VHPVVEIVPQGTLPRTEFKARRVIDDRDLYRDVLDRKEV
jgi:phenylacetate-coenzyme A ligase PaaK-like adenylate-forming protein